MLAVTGLHCSHRHGKAFAQVAIRRAWFRGMAPGARRLAAWGFHDALHVFIQDGLGVFFVGIFDWHPDAAHVGIA